MMGKDMPQLAVVKVKSISKQGRHGDGAGLYLNIAAAGSKSWVQRIVIDGRRRDIGLGGLPAVSLAQPHLSLGLLEAFLDGPPGSGHSHQFPQGRVRRAEAYVVGQFLRTQPDPSICDASRSARTWRGPLSVQAPNFSLLLMAST